jgi:hypothetical protein
MAHAPMAGVTRIVLKRALATDKHGWTRMNTDSFNNKNTSVLICVDLCSSVANVLIKTIRVIRDKAFNDFN